MKRPRPAPPGRAKVLSHSRAVWSGYAILLALGSWLYFGALVGHGVEVDDEICIQHSGILSGDLSALWSPDWLYPGRPTVLLLFALVHCLSGTAPASYHILTILCHTLAAFLLARVCCRLGGSLEIGLLGGVLFLVNVAHFRAVHWISASAYPLALLFSLVAILFYLRFEERKNTVWLAGTYGSFLVAVLAHVSAVAVLPFCLFTSWLNNRDVRFAAVRLLPLSLLLAGVVASLVWLYPHTVQVYHSAHLPDLPLALRHYFWLWSRLVTTAHWMLVPLWEYREWEPVVGLLAFGVAAALVSRRTSFVTVWGVWIALTTLPFANLFLRSLAADGAGPSRHLYMASAGSSLVLAWLLSQGRQWLRKRSYWLGAAVYIGVVGALLGSSYSALQRGEGIAFYNEGKYLIRKRDTAQGVDRLRQAAMRYPEFLPRARVAVDLALGLVLDGKEEEASSVLRRSIESDPDNPAVRAVLGAIETTAADTAVRRRGLERIEAITDLDWGSGPGDPLVPTMSAIYRHIWEGLFRNQQYERAVIAIEHSLKYAHEKEIPLLNLGMTYNKMARHEQALAAFDGVLEMNADDPEAHFQTGVANGAMGRYQKALAAYRRAVSLRPAFSEALLNLGVTHLHLGRLDSAESAFRRALEAHPDSEGSRQGLARVMLATGQVGAARQALKEALTLWPRNKIFQRMMAEADARLGHELLSRGKADDAAAALERSVAVDPESPTSWALLAEASVARGMTARAIEAYRAAVRLNPRLAGAYNNLGLVYQRAGHLDEAEEMYRAALEIDPQLVDAHFNLGNLFLEQELFRRRSRSTNGRRRWRRSTPRSM